VTLEYAGVGSKGKVFAVRTAGEVNRALHKLSIETEPMAKRTYDIELGKYDSSFWALPALEERAQFASNQAARDVSGDLFAECRQNVVTLSIGQANDPVWWWARRCAVSGAVAAVFTGSLWELTSLHTDWWTNESREYCECLAALLNIEKGKAYSQVDPEADPAPLLDLTSEAAWRCGPRLLPGTWLPGNDVPPDCGLRTLVECTEEMDEEEIGQLYQSLPLQPFRHAGKNDLQRDPKVKLKILTGFASCVCELEPDTNLSDTEADGVESAASLYRAAACKTMSPNTLKNVLLAMGFPRNHALASSTSIRVLTVSGWPAFLLLVGCFLSIYFLLGVVAAVVACT
jgi:hypothetical protein